MSTLVCERVTEVLIGLDAAQRARVAALRAAGPLLLARRLARPSERRRPGRGAGGSRGCPSLPPGSGRRLRARTVHADVASVAFTLRCYVESEAPGGRDGPLSPAPPLEVACRRRRALPDHRPCGAALAARGPRSRSAAEEPVQETRRLHGARRDPRDARSRARRDRPDVSTGLAESVGRRRRGRPCRGASLRGGRQARDDAALGPTAQQAVIERSGVEIRTLRGFESARTSGTSTDSTSSSTACRPPSTPPRMRWGRCSICS